MTQLSLLERAKQGDAAAIAALLNRSFRMQGIVANAQCQQGLLSVMLEADPVPEQISSVRFVQRSLTQLAPAAICTVRIFGRHQGAPSAAWSHQFALTSPQRDRESAPLAPSTPLATVEHPASGNQRPYHSRADQAGEGSRISTPAVPNRPSSPSASRQPLDSKALEAAIAGLVLAMLMLLSQQVTFIFSYFITLVHELGHAFTAWSFGYPAIPAFDFLYGGGLTVNLSRLPLLVTLLYAALAFLVYRYRHNPLTLKLLLVFIGLYTCTAFTPLHSILQIAMGHGFELLFAGIFLYRGLSGYGCRYSIERPLYAMLAFFTTFRGINFSWRLLVDRTYRLIYEEGKGGLLDHDFVRLAGDYFGVDLSVVAAGFLLCCLATPVMTALLFRYRSRWGALLQRLGQAKADAVS